MSKSSTGSKKAKEVVGYVGKPLGDRVIVKQEEAEEESAGGIIIPESAKEKPERGIVIAVGGKVTELAPGDTVLFGHYAGIIVKLKGVDYLIMKEADILVKL